MQLTQLRHYICMLSHRYHDEILFYHEGGVDVGDVDAKAEKLELETGEAMTEALVTEKLLSKLPAAKKANMASFICSLYKFYGDLHFAYLEINPLVTHLFSGTNYFSFILFGGSPKKGSPFFQGR